MRAIMNKKKASFTAAALAARCIQRGRGGLWQQSRLPQSRSWRAPALPSAVSGPAEKGEDGGYVLEQVLGKSPEKGVTVTVSTPDGKAQVLNAASSSAQGENGPGLRFHLTEAGKAE